MNALYNLILKIFSDVNIINNRAFSDKQILHKFFFTSFIFLSFSLFSYCNEYDVYYDIITQEGDVYIETSDVGSLYKADKIPVSRCTIITYEDSFIVMKLDNEIIIVLPKTKVDIVAGAFHLAKGFFYVESENGTKIKIEDGGKYSILEGSSFCVYKSENGVYVSAYSSAMRIRTDTVGINYLVPCYNKLKIFPSLSIPESMNLGEIENAKEIKAALSKEVKEHLNKSVKRESFKIFANTAYETIVYRVVHEKKGKNVFIFVPHGDERAAVNAAINRIMEPIISGSITIVPIALTPAYENNTRGVGNKDLNRQFKPNMTKGKSMIEKIAYKYASMLTEYKIDLVITLHEGNGVNEKFKDAIVYDKKEFTSIATQVVSNINKRIEPTKYKFKTMLYPMPDTFTYYAASKGIKSFGVEITRNLPDDIKVLIKNAIIDEFLKLYGLY